MNIPDDILTPAEAFALRLRELFARRGYTRYEMNKFEEYDLYANNRKFFGGDIITFTGAGGRLMALRPDVTLSVVKNVVPEDGKRFARVYYHESVYRRAGLSREFRELKQCGVECIGGVGEAETANLLALAWESLTLFGGRCVLDVSHAGSAKKRDESDRIIARFKELCPEADIRVDLDVPQDSDYYNGIIFKGYVEGYPSEVLSGGRYDKLMKKFGKPYTAAGFAVYADMYRGGDSID